LIDVKPGFNVPLNTL